MYFGVVSGLAGLLSPIEVKGLEFKNRIVMPPMQTGLATFKGAATRKLIEHYVRRSKPLGLVIVEHCYVSLNGKVSSDQLGIHDNDLVKGLEDLSSAVHATGTPIVVQINHAGKAASEDATGMTPVAPSAEGDVRELRREEIQDLTKDFAAAAEKVMKAGFDGVEVHGAHGFLLNQFFSPLTNQRRDEYGGSFENRTRFPLEVVERVREKVDGRLLLYRLGSDDLDPKGIGIEDSKKFATELEKAGVDIIDVSGGLCGSRPARLQGKQGYFIPQAECIKKMVRVPVIGVGGVTEPKYADRLVLQGKVDFVAVGRALLGDPDWGAKAIEALKSV